MQHFTLVADTDDGAMLVDAFVTGQSAAGVIVYMDIFGIREDLRDVCRGYAAAGFDVVLPNLFHRLSPSTFPPMRRRDDPMPQAAIAANRATSVQQTVSDTDDLFHAIDGEPQITAQRWAALGFCMGGRHAIAAAAAYPDRIGAAASIHGSRLVDDTAFSAHRRMRHVEGGLYFAFCRDDHSWPPQDRERIITDSAGCKAKVSHDIFEAPHGFAIPGRWCHDEPAAATVRSRVTALLRTHLSQ